MAEKIALMAEVGTGYGDSLCLLSVIQDLSNQGHEVHVLAHHPEVFDGQIGVTSLYPTAHAAGFWDNVAKDADRILRFRYWEINGRMRGFKDTLLNNLREMAGLPPTNKFPTYKIISGDLRSAKLLCQEDPEPEVIENGELRPLVYSPPNEKDYIVVHYGLGRVIKLMAKDEFEKVIDILKEKYNIVQIGYIYDDLLEGVIDLRGKLSFGQSMAVMMISKFMVGHDSMPVHASGIVETPGVFIYGPTSPADFGYAHNENIFTGKCSQEKSAPCGRPCPWNFDYIYGKKGQKTDWFCPDRICINDIGVEHVIEGVKKLEERIKDGINWNLNKGST